MKREWPSARSMGRAMRTFNAATRKVAKLTGALLVDAESVVPKTWDYFADDIHTTELGGQTVGAEAARVIMDAGLIEQWFDVGK